MKIYYSGTLLKKGENPENVLKHGIHIMLAFGYSIGDWLGRRIRPLYRMRRKK